MPLLFQLLLIPLSPVPDKPSATRSRTVPGLESPIVDLAQNKGQPARSDRADGRDWLSPTPPKNPPTPPPPPPKKKLDSGKRKSARQSRAGEWSQESYNPL